MLLHTPTFLNPRIPFIKFLAVSCRNMFLMSRLVRHLKMQKIGGSTFLSAINHSTFAMTTEVGENIPPPAKRRKLTEKAQKGDDAEPFYPFRLVPSPQEARGLETSTFPLMSLFTSSGRLGDLFYRCGRCL